MEALGGAAKKAKTTSARQRYKLSAVGLKKLPPGHHGDGDGLYLHVTEGGTYRSWVFRYKWGDKTREMGLGALHTFNLGDARERARQCRQQVESGTDPIEARKAAKEARIRDANAKTFDQCVVKYIELHRPSWKNAKHADQWQNTLRTYASPVIGSRRVRDVTADHLSEILAPIWGVKHETATRVRQRIALVLDWAKAKGYRSGDNPAQKGGALDADLPKIAKARLVKHHPALPYAQVKAFMPALSACAGVAARALEFLVLTAARTGEVTCARWDEIDLDAEVWTIPAARMKAHKEHRIPLSGRALDILRELDKAKIDDFVFPGGKEGKSLSNAAMAAVIDRMRAAGQVWNDRDGRAITPHGFRSTFRDWAGEMTRHPREVIEHALAHQLKDKAEAAYQRGTLFEKRRALMTDWTEYCKVPA